ncbi:hypothetical protein BKA64DRAFT_378499 [Cadophora sp. MPI-SDFR-AT-0126]|nr:hypothetical protein BKA64DRAFT_378499 [Leotiomycetes sp. MPI-SDFR-AT-0126]
MVISRRVLAAHGKATLSQQPFLDRISLILFSHDFFRSDDCLAIHHSHFRTRFQIASRTLITMSPQSNSSSMGAQNGSAYDYSSSPPTSTGDSRYPPQRQLSNPSAVAYNHQERTAPTSEAPSTHENDASTEHCTGAHLNSGPHYFPDYERETPHYDDELIVDDDHQNTEPVAETPSYGGDTQQDSAQYQDYRNNRPNGAHSPTTERWRAEQSPEERVRLGLSRYPSEEDQCLAYKGAVEDESRRGE